MLSIPDIIRQRLFGLHIAETTFTKPEELVAHLGAMQAQDWNMAKWAIGLRLSEVKDTEVEKLFNEGKILRTHIMRPTWHFVTPKDILWMQELTSPRVNTFNGVYYRKSELDDKIFKRAFEVLIKSLEGKKFLTRTQLAEELSKKKITTDSMRLSLIMMKAELDGLICSGPREGKQFTYALISERAPKAKRYNRDEALGMLTEKYFTTRGPATLKDFMWWSGLTMKEIKEGVAMLQSTFVKDNIEKNEYFYIPHKTKLTSKHQTTFLLPDYDEYGISYKDRSAFMPDIPASAIFEHNIIVDGVQGGTWKRTVKGKKMDIEVRPNGTLSKAKTLEIQKAVQRYYDFWQ